MAACALRHVNVLPDPASTNACSSVECSQLPRAISCMDGMIDTITKLLPSHVRAATSYLCALALMALTCRLERTSILTVQHKRPLKSR
jgi:hypothetical protein